MQQPFKQLVVLVLATMLPVFRDRKGEETKEEKCGESTLPIRDMVKASLEMQFLGNQRVEVTPWQRQRVFLHLQPPAHLYGASVR